MIAPGTWLVIYWLACAFPTGYILNKQSKKASIDGVIGNTPGFNALIAGIGGGLFMPVYGIIKLVKWVSGYAK